MTPLERAARALEAALPDVTDIAQGGFYPDDLRAGVRAVLTAIREPADAMHFAGAAHLKQREDHFNDASVVFAAMIDAALAEGE